MEPFVGQIQSFSFNFPPRGWAQCNGQLMAIAQNQALFSLLGTTFGGDGITTFALPDLRGRVQVSQGQGSGLTIRNMGERFGTETVTLQVSNLPQHTHTLSGNTTANADTALNNSIGGQVWAPVSPNTTANPNDVTSAGSDQPHNNIQPTLGIGYCIALQGIFPSRN